MRNILFLTALILFINFSPPTLAQNKRLTNTKWIVDNGDCKELLEFGKKNNYKINNCETGNTLYGKYSQKGNEVILEQFRSDFDKAFKKLPGYKSPKARFKLVIDKNNMKYFVRWDIDNAGNWVISKYDSDKEYVYVKK